MSVLMDLVRLLVQATPLTVKKSMPIAVPIAMVTLVKVLTAGQFWQAGMTRLMVKIPLKPLAVTGLMRQPRMITFIALCRLVKPSRLPMMKPI